MEIILAIVVATAVIFFGALISMGNERQGKAIETLREQIELWAVQDLMLKREKLIREVRVDDPLVWLNQVVTKVSGLAMNLQSVEYLEEAHTLLCKSGNHETRILLSPFSPKEIQGIKSKRRSRLSQFDKNNPLLSLSRAAIAYEFSVLNAGILFDLELPLAWNGLTGRKIDQLERLWMYKE